MEFQYTDSMGRYQELLGMPLASLRCKHVMSLLSPKALKQYKYSLETGYPQAVWGYGCGIYKDPEANWEIQVHTIRRMIYKGFCRPFRVVIDSEGIPWADNLHSAIRDILVFGEGLELMGARFYIVDLSGPMPVVADAGGSLSRNLDDIQGAIRSAMERDSRVDGRIRDVHYTIGEFMDENGINREAIGLPKADYGRYLDVYWKERGV